MTDFRVVPQALQDCATQFGRSEAGWREASKKVTGNGSVVGESELGILGVGVAAALEEACKSLAKKLESGADVVAGGARALRTVADVYTWEDAGFWRKHGYPDEQHKR